MKTPNKFIIYGLAFLALGIGLYIGYQNSNFGNSNVDMAAQNPDGSTGSSGTGIKNSPNGKFDCSGIPKIDDMTKPYHSYCLDELVEADQTIPSVTIDNVDCVEIERESLNAKYNNWIRYRIDVSGTATGPVANGHTLNVFYAYPGTVLSKIGEYGTPTKTAVNGFDLTAIDWPIINLDPRVQEDKGIYRRIYQPATTKWTASGSVSITKGYEMGVMVVELHSSKSDSVRIIVQATKGITCQ